MKSIKRVLDESSTLQTSIVRGTDLAVSIQKSIYDPKSKDDGLRVLVMRYWPRGVKKERVDIWFEDLGTSKELIRAWKAGMITWAQFRSRYLAELKEARKQALIRVLAARARKERVTLLCGCRDPNRCHRILLKEQIQSHSKRHAAVQSPDAKSIREQRH